MNAFFSWLGKLLIDWVAAKVAALSKWYFAVKEEKEENKAVREKTEAAETKEERDEAAESVIRNWKS